MFGVWGLGFGRADLQVKELLLILRVGLEKARICGHVVQDRVVLVHGESPVAHLFEVLAFRYRVQDSGFRVLDVGSRVQGLGFRVQGSGFRV